MPDTDTRGGAWRVGFDVCGVRRESEAAAIRREDHDRRARLKRDIDITGHPVALLWLASSEPDAAVFLYLFEIEADGQRRYVTEGMLRAIHRADGFAPDNYRTTWPWHTFARSDARPMPIGKPELLRFPPLPIAWTFAKGQPHPDFSCRR